MKIDGLNLIEGSAIQNMSVATGSAFPSSPNSGELFFRTDGANLGMYFYDGTSWTQIQTTGGSLDADLAAIAALTGTGLARRTAPDTWSLDSNAYITGNQSITVSGDAAGSGTTSIALTLATVNLDDGSYGSGTSIPTFTVNTKGLITAAGSTAVTPDWTSITNPPTTLSGYGITDAQPLDADLTSIAGLAGTSGLLRKTAANTWSLDTATYLTDNQSITLSGDVTGSGTTAITTTLANTGVTPGSNYNTFTVNAKGLITAASTTGYLTSNQSITVSGDASGTGATSIALTFATVNSNVGSFGSATQTPTFTVNAKGLITAAGQTTVTPAWGSITSTPTTLAGYGITDAALDSGVVHLAGTETITGNKTFTGTATVQEPTSSSHAATKNYADTIAMAMAIVFGG